MTRVRADLLVQRLGFAETRTKAQALILAGEIVAGEHRVEKPGQLLDETVALRRKGAAPGTPEEFTAFMKSEIEKWGKVIRAAGIKAE